MTRFPACGLAAFLSLLAAAPGSRGQSHSALDFDGIDDHVVIGSSMPLSSGPFTIEAWIDARASDGGRALSTRDGANGYEIDVAGNGSPVIRFSVNGSVRLAPPFGAQMNTWTHVAVTWDGTNEDGGLNLYLDGTLAQTGIMTQNIVDSGANLTFGQMADGGFAYEGRVDEIRVWFEELDPLTIDQWKAGRVDATHPNFAALAASWRLDENGGQTISSDVGGAGLDGTLGPTAAKEGEDPMWVDSGVVPVRVVSLSEIKAAYATP